MISTHGPFSSCFEAFNCFTQSSSAHPFSRILDFQIKGDINNNLALLLLSFNWMQVTTPLLLEAHALSNGR